MRAREVRAQALWHSVLALNLWTSPQLATPQPALPDEVAPLARPGLPPGSLGSCGRTALTPWGAGARTNSLASAGQRHQVQRSSTLQYSAAFINLGMCESPGKLSTTACGFTVTIANYWQLSGDNPNLLFFLFCLTISAFSIRIDKCIKQ